MTSFKDITKGFIVKEDYGTLVVPWGSVLYLIYSERKDDKGKVSQIIEAAFIGTRSHISKDLAVIKAQITEKQADEYLQVLKKSK